MVFKWRSLYGGPLWGGRVYMYLHTVVTQEGQASTGEEA